jgi:hypothetical protein
VADDDFSTLLAGLDAGAKCALHEELTRELYGVSVQEFVGRSIEFGRQFEREQVAEAAKEASKGGRPLRMALHLAAFMVTVVDEEHARGVPYAKAVADFLKRMALGHFVSGLSDLPDSEIEAEVSKFLKRWKNPAKKIAMLKAAGLPGQDTAENIYYRKGDYCRHLPLADRFQVIEKIDKRHC